MYRFDWTTVWSVLPTLAQGLRVTVELTVVVILIGMIAAVPIALLRMSNIQLLRWPAQLYIEVFRCTPLLVQLIWIYYALPALTGITLNSAVSVIIALSANLAAYMAEAYRAGFQAVPREHIEAAQVLGLSRLDILRHVSLPQVVRQQIPVILSLNVMLLKDTSLVSTLGVADLTYLGNLQASQTFRPLEVFTEVAVLYFLIAFPATLVISAVERRLIKSQDQGAPGARRMGLMLRRALPLNRWDA